MTWGDEAADVMDHALDVIRNVFIADVGRHPTAAELRYGLEFSLAGMGEA